MGDLQSHKSQKVSVKEGLLVSLVNLCRDIRLSSAVHYHKFINPADYVLVFVRVGMFR